MFYSKTLLSNSSRWHLMAGILGRHHPVHCTHPNLPFVLRYYLRYYSPVIMTSAQKTWTRPGQSHRLTCLSGHLFRWLFTQPCNYCLSVINFIWAGHPLLMPAHTRKDLGYSWRCFCEGSPGVIEGTACERRAQSANGPRIWNRRLWFIKNPDFFRNRATETAYNSKLRQEVALQSVNAGTVRRRVTRASRYSRLTLDSRHRRPATDRLADAGGCFRKKIVTYLLRVVSTSGFRVWIPKRWRFNTVWSGR